MRALCKYPEPSESDDGTYLNVCRRKMVLQMQCGLRKRVSRGSSSLQMECRTPCSTPLNHAPSAIFALRVLVDKLLLPHATLSARLSKGQNYGAGFVEVWTRGAST